MSLPTSPRVPKLLKLAEKISREMGWKYVGTEHILLALFRIKNGLGNQMLVATGASEKVARKELEHWNDPTKKLREEIVELRAKLASDEKNKGEA